MGPDSNLTVEKDEGERAGGTGQGTGSRGVISGRELGGYGFQHEDEIIRSSSRSRW